MNMGTKKTMASIVLTVLSNGSLYSSKLFNTLIESYSLELACVLEASGSSATALSLHPPHGWPTLCRLSLPSRGCSLPREGHWSHFPPSVFSGMRQGKGPSSSLHPLSCPLTYSAGSCYVFQLLEPKVCTLWILSCSMPAFLQGLRRSSNWLGYLD